MNERAVATGLFLLPFLYIAALLLPLFPHTDFGVYFAFATCLAIALILGLGGSTGQLIAVALDIVLVVLVVAALVGATTFGGLASQLTAGVLIGLPFLVSALAWRERSGLAHRTLALAVAIAVGTALLAAREAVVNSTGPATSTNFVQAFFTVNVSQLGGLGAIAAGLSEPDLPLRSAFDPVFAALCALAAAGVLLLALRPRSGSEESLPVAATLGSLAPRSDVDRLIPFSEAQRRAFESRSSNQPPTGAWPPGLGSVFAAAFAAGGFVAAAFLLPLYTPLLLAVGVAALLGGVGWVTARRGIRVARPVR
jgi:hypothetical protein